MRPTVTNNTGEQRYEAWTDGADAVLEYDLHGNRIELLHTEVPKALEGRGVGGALAHAALEDAKTRGLTVVPLCPFVQEYIRRHPEYRPLVAPEHLGRL